MNRCFCVVDLMFLVFMDFEHLIDLKLMSCLPTAIITLKLESVQCSAAPTENQPMQLAELMPLKKGSDEVEIERHEDDKEKDAKDKKSWKSCLQLWNSSTSFNNSTTASAADRSLDLKQDRKAETTKVQCFLHILTAD